MEDKNFSRNLLILLTNINNPEIQKKFNERFAERGLAFSTFFANGFTKVQENLKSFVDSEIQHGKPTIFNLREIHNSIYDSRQ